MNAMIEVYLGPQNLDDKDTIVSRLSKLHGSLTFEEKNEIGQSGLCLTFEFDSEKQAHEALNSVISMGVHAEGPYSY